MSKRKREATSLEDAPSKKRKGFTVGPANLPDGTYRRKTQKIKNDLIQKAKVRKAYAKIKESDVQEQEAHLPYDPYAEVQDPTRVPARAADGDDTADADTEEHVGGIHPQRQAMLDRQSHDVEDGDDTEDEIAQMKRDRKRNRKRAGNRSGSNSIGINATPMRYKKEFAQAEERKAQMQEREKAREQRERERRAMLKAKRAGRDGKQKLGRQSAVLLSRVQRLVGQS